MKKRIERAYVDPHGCLIVASMNRGSSVLQHVTDRGKLEYSIHVLVKQINAMIDDAEERGFQNGVELKVQSPVRKTWKVLRAWGVALPPEVNPVEIIVAETVIRDSGSIIFLNEGEPTVAMFGKHHWKSFQQI